MFLLLLWSIFGCLRSEILFNIDLTNCTCVPYFQCSDETGDVITDGSGLLESRKFNSGLCTGYYDVCCKAPKTITTDAPIELKGCGYQKPELFPWSGALFYQETVLSPPKYKCGVSLIHKQVVLTTAHCIIDGILTVQIGNIIEEVAKVITHENYSYNTLQNDLSLLILKDPIETRDNIEIICIPPPGIALDDTECIVTTWNKNVFFNVQNSRLTLMKTPIVAKNKCLNVLRKTRLGQFFQLHRSFICAGGEGNNDVCGGDGGSPLVCQIPGQAGRYHQAGIVAWGIGCGQNDIPGVYVNLPIFRDWIDQHMLKLGFEIYSYRY